MSIPERPQLAVVTSTPQHRQKILRRRLPKPIITVQQRSKLRLHELLTNCFSTSDDHFFDLAKNALQQEDQDGYFCAMRELRGKKSKVFETFFDGLEHGFLGLADVDELRHSGDAFAAASVDQLALVGNDDLDQLVAKEAMVNRCLSQCNVTIEQLTRRFDAVVPMDVGIEQLPVSPNHLCELFIKACKTLDINAKSLMVLFKVFERTVLQQLHSLYIAMNAHLEERGILPHKAALPNNVTPANHMVPGGRSSGGLDLPVESEFLHLDASMLVPPLPRSSTSARSASSANNTVKSNDDKRLQTERTLPLSETVVTSHGQTVSQDSSASRYENTVANILAVLTSRQDIAAPFIPLLQQLQNPVVRIAQSDSSFFSNNDHAARRLINALSTSAIAFDQSAATDIEADPLFAKIKAVISQLQDKAYSHPQAIHELTKDFEQFARQEQRRADLYEKRMLDAEHGKHKAQTARKQALKAIADITQGLEISGSVRQIIDKAWYQVMFVTVLKYGQESPQWDHASQTLIDLVTSTQPYVSCVERSHGLQSLDDLKARVRAGLESLFFDAFETDKIIKQLDHTVRQLAQEKRVSESPAATPPTPQTDAAVNEQAQPAKTVEPPPSPPVNAAFMAQAKNLSRGSWFDLTIDGTQTRCRLAAIIDAYEKYIFVQRNGSKVAEKTLEEVAQALAIQELTALDSNKIFDQALEQVIAGMRK